jgi:hypothetical protein
LQRCFSFTLLFFCFLFLSACAKEEDTEPILVQNDPLDECWVEGEVETEFKGEVGFRPVGGARIYLEKRPSSGGAWEKENELRAVSSRFGRFVFHFKSDHAFDYRIYVEADGYLTVSDDLPLLCGEWDTARPFIILDRK